MVLLILIRPIAALSSVLDSPFEEKLGAFFLLLDAYLYQFYLSASFLLKSTASVLTSTLAKRRSPITKIDPEMTTKADHGEFNFFCRPLLFQTEMGKVTQPKRNFETELSKRVKPSSFSP